MWHCSVRSGDAHVLTGPCERRALALQSARILHSFSPPLVPPVHLQRHQVYASTTQRMHFLECGFARAYDCPDSVLALGDALGKGCKWAACCEVHACHAASVHICVCAQVRSNRALCCLLISSQAHWHNAYDLTSQREGEVWMWTLLPRETDLKPSHRESADSEPHYRKTSDSDSSDQESDSEDRETSDSDSSDQESDSEDEPGNPKVHWWRMVGMLLFHALVHVGVRSCCLRI